jgi:hypothetical protein
MLDVKSSTPGPKQVVAQFYCRGQSNQQRQMYTTSYIKGAPYRLRSLLGPQYCVRIDDNDILMGKCGDGGNGEKWSVGRLDQLGSVI